jgi:DeoR/GlpR family transcriptional regulator of sugar metabolism
VKVALGGSAAEVVLAVTASKLEHRATARAFSFERIDVLVTELNPADSCLDPFRDRVKIR